MQDKNHEYCVFVYKRGNCFNGLKLSEDGSIISSLVMTKDDRGKDFDFIRAVELTIETTYGTESNSEAYKFLSSAFSNGDIIKITCTLDENGVVNKAVKKVMDKEFCSNTKKSWDEIKWSWNRPEEASKRIEEHLKEIGA